MRGFFSKQGQSLMYSATQRHPNFNPTPIPPPALRRLNGYMAFPGFLYCLNKSRSDFQFSVEYAKGNFYSKNNQPLFDLLFAIFFRIEMY